MLFTSKSDQAIRDLNLAERIEADRLRKQRMADRYQILAGDWEHLVVKEIARTFGNKQILTTPDVTLNPAKCIVEEIYRHPGAQRAFVTDPEGTQEDPTFAALLDRMSVQRVMSRATTLLGAFNDLLIRTLPGTAPGSDPTLRIFCPHEVTVIEDRADPSQAAVVTYEVDDLDGTWQVVWTPTEHYRVSPKGKILPVPGATDLSNPLGYLPFVAVHAGERADAFWDTSTHEALFRSTLSLAVGWSLLNHHRSRSNFSQPMIVGAPRDYKPPVEIDPTRLWVIEGTPGLEPPQVTALPLTADLTASMETLREQLGQLSASYGLSREALLRLTAAPASGFARLLERAPLLERRAQVLPYIEDAEYDLADQIRTAWNLTSTPAIPESAAFSLTWNEETAPQSPAEVEDAKAKHLANLKTELDLGIRSKAEIVAELRGVSVEEAEAIVADIEAAKPQPTAPASPFAALLGKR